MQHRHKPVEIDTHVQHTEVIMLCLKCKSMRKPCKPPKNLYNELFDFLCIFCKRPCC